MADYSAPGSIHIEQAILKNFDGSFEIDITPSILEFNVYESVSANFVTANFVIEDSLSLTTIIPIVGQETLALSFKTPHDDFPDKVSLNLRVVAIDKLVRDKIRSTHYILRCFVPQMIKDMNTKIRKAYSSMSINQMVYEIAKEYLGIEEIVESEETEGNRTIVIPNMNPTRAINFLCKEAKSTEFPASNFRFFQTADGFSFKTIDSMITPSLTEDDKRKYLDRYYASESDFSNPQKKILATSGYRPIGRSNKGSYFDTKPEEFMQIRSFEFVSLGNYYNSTRYGALESKIRVLDPTTSLYKETKYNYKENSKDFKKTTQKTPFDLLTKEADFYGPENETRIFFIMGNKQQQNGNIESDQKEDMIHLKVASEYLLENIVVNIEIAGDSTKRAGQTCLLDFPEYGATDDIELKLNKYISGEYFIASIRHIYNAESYKTIMTCCKNAYESEISNHNENTLKE